MIDRILPNAFFPYLHNTQVHRKLLERSGNATGNASNLYTYTPLFLYLSRKSNIFFFFFSESDCRNCELNLSCIYSSDVPSCQWQVHGRIDSTKIRNIARTGRRRRRRKSTSPNQAERIIYNTYTCVQLVYTCQI